MLAFQEGFCLTELVSWLDSPQRLTEICGCDIEMNHGCTQYVVAGL
jgi:hypothetical protein